jgi:hypothetical protein
VTIVAVALALFPTDVKDRYMNLKAVCEHDENRPVSGQMTQFERDQPGGSEPEAGRANSLKLRHLSRDRSVISDDGEGEDDDDEEGEDGDHDEEKREYDDDKEPCKPFQTASSVLRPVGFHHVHTLL